MTIMYQALLHVLSNLTLLNNPLEKATLSHIIWMVGMRIRDIKLIIKIEQVADRAEIQSPSMQPQVDRFSTSCSCLFHMESSTRSCDSGRDCGDSFTAFSSIGGQMTWHRGLF